ncbi:hypothetical protein THC_0757 [Caldimicrobium thiodismutans]|uniref:Uncharacterized protein n=1 Tax=Caldimicrobium thiodismutans TaxID=1653476 RepID=A0A0U5AGM1_9BACT|nr:hypothetical protein [Caldimicrobium thiodismutans]BAU23148.1 hypothetical protein THC_0757 [Caldimicrobium thiodismutans]
MVKKNLYIIIFFLFAEIILARSAYSQNLPTPGMVIDCYSTLEAWKNDASLRNYNCYCPSPNSRPVCTSNGGDSHSTPSAPSGLSPSQQIQLMMIQSILQPFFNSVFNFDNLFSPPSKDTSFQQKQQEILRKQQEEAKKKAMEAWKNHLKKAEEQAQNEALARQKAGQNILSQVRIGGGPMGSYTIIGPRAPERETPTSINWDSPRATISTAKSSETAKEQLLRAIYFSKMAETFLQSGDLEAARFYAGLAFEGGANAPILIDYKPPKELLDAINDKKVAELNKQYTKFASFYKIVLPMFENLQSVYYQLEQIKYKKIDLQRKIKEAEKEIKEIERKKQITETQEKKLENDDLLAKALALKQQAEAEYQEALQNEHKLLNEKQEIENKLAEMRNKI